MQPMRVGNMPAMTELMIRRLPSLYPLQAVNIDSSKEGVKLTKSIQNNINIIKQHSVEIAAELQEKLNIQIAIIEHGYAGIGDNWGDNSEYEKQRNHETKNN